MKDLHAPKHLTVHIRKDGQALWINNEVECLLRANHIGNLVLEDDRKWGGLELFLAAMGTCLVLTMSTATVIAMYGAFQLMVYGVN